jgi:glycosyltransferase involved in cell wall biosynthesis
MRVDLYTRCWNDAHMLGFFFRHYDDIVNRYIVFDDGSTDGSLEILKSKANVEIRPAPRLIDPTSRMLSNLPFHESCWKESRGRADWVIQTDIDEHLHHRDLRTYLERCKRSGITIIPALGYQMISDEVPPEGARLSRDLVIGAPWLEMNKLSIFSPDDVSATHFRLGRHSAAPAGNIVAPAREEVLLLHYKYLGFERTYQRHLKFSTRLGERDRANGWGHKYLWSKEELRADWENVKALAVDVSSDDLRPWETHAAPRWWMAIPRAAVSI